MSQSIRYDVDDGVAVITIDRPTRRKAMSCAVLTDFHEAAERAARAGEVKAVVITGAGGAFSAGTDLSDLADTPVAGRGDRVVRDERRSGWPLQQCPKPVVAAVDGPAVGMGAELTTQCEVRIARTRARFAWNFVHRGLDATRQAMAACFGSKDHKEGGAAFLGRREARFVGR